jgi:alanine dehydrogenase
MEVRYLLEPEIRTLIDPGIAHKEVHNAFASLAKGAVVLPEVMYLDLKEHHGEVHGKGAYIDGSPHFAIKVATGFASNASIGLPTNSGVVLVFDASTGFLNSILFDNGYLSELRTGAAGGVGTDLLARRDVNTVGLLGCGIQAYYQLEAVLEVRSPSRILCYCRTPATRAQFAKEMSERFQVAVTTSERAEDLVRESDVIITVTPSHEPVVMDEWVQPGTHITAIGADTPDKHELESALLGRAVVVADSLAQCLTQGEIHHAVEEGVLSPADVYAELGEVASGMRPGRSDNTEITICDFTGVGVLDTAVASFVASEASRKGMGQTISV